MKVESTAHRAERPPEVAKTSLMPKNLRRRFLKNQVKK